MIYMYLCIYMYIYVTVFINIIPFGSSVGCTNHTIGPRDANAVNRIQLTSRLSQWCWVAPRGGVRVGWRGGGGALFALPIHQMTGWTRETWRHAIQAARSYGACTEVVDIGFTTLSCALDLLIVFFTIFMPVSVLKPLFLKMKIFSATTTRKSNILHLGSGIRQHFWNTEVRIIL